MIWCVFMFLSDNYVYKDEEQDSGVILVANTEDITDGDEHERLDEDKERDYREDEDEDCSTEQEGDEGTQVVGVALAPNVSLSTV